VPNPFDPNEAECKRCFDTGFAPGSYDPCWCQHSHPDHMIKLDTSCLACETYKRRNGMWSHS